jgi:hypothetical protein
MAKQNKMVPILVACVILIDDYGSPSFLPLFFVIYGSYGISPFVRYFIGAFQQELENRIKGRNKN